MEPEKILNKLLEFFRDHKAEYEGELYPDNRINLDFVEIIAFDYQLADAILEDGLSGMKALEQMAQAGLVSESPVKVILHNIHNTVPFREIRDKHFGEIIEIEGIIKHRSGIKTRITSILLKCRECLHEIWWPQEQLFRVYPPCCVCGRKTVNGLWKIIGEESTSQISVRVEEIQSGDSTEFDKLNVRVEHPLTEIKFIPFYSPGERVKIIGILKKEQRYVGNKPTNKPKRYFEAINVLPLDERPDDKITPIDIKQFKEISTWPISKKIEIIAPAIVGHDLIKEALLLQLVGGVYKERELAVKREFISILLVGDPSTGKSVIGRSIIPLKARARYVGGSKGATGVGLTAGLVRDEDGNFALACGAVVLANGSILVVDEFEKMHQDAIEPLHESMSVGTVTINKGGINATMNARTAILAIANPKFGRWDNCKPLIDQVELQPSLLSRFDFIFAVKDQSDEHEDRKIAKGILNVAEQHEKLDLKDYQLFRKFIAYSSKISPVVTKEASKLIEDFFVETRKKARQADGKNVPLGFRQLDSLVRLTEAYAKLRLSKKATTEDANKSISLITKCLAKLGVDLESGLAEIDKIEMGKTSTRKKSDFIINQIPAGEIVEIEDVINACKVYGLDKREVENIIEKMKQDGEIYEPQPSFLKRL